MPKIIKRKKKSLLCFQLLHVSDTEPHLQAQAGCTIPSPSCVLTFPHLSKESDRFKLHSSDQASDVAVNPGI